VQDVVYGDLEEIRNNLECWRETRRAASGVAGDSATLQRARW